MESKRVEGRVLRAEQITNGESVWGASERRERPTSASTRARVVSIDGSSHKFDFFILFSGNRQIPGLATGAVGHSLFYSRR